MLPEKWRHYLKLSLTKNIVSGRLNAAETAEGQGQGIVLPAVVHATFDPESKVVALNIPENPQAFMSQGIEGEAEHCFLYVTFWLAFATGQMFYDFRGV